MRFVPLLFAVMASPAFAASGSEVPEPSSLALFGIGVLGLVVGRQASKRGPSSDEE